MPTTTTRFLTALDILRLALGRLSIAPLIDTYGIDLAVEWAERTALAVDRGYLRVVENYGYELTEAGSTLWDELHDAEADEAYYDEGPSCSICDALGHGYVGGPPCPLEDRGYDTDGYWR